MEAEALRTVGQIGGIGGIALGVMLFLFRDIIRKNIFPKLAPEKAYRLLRLITVCVWSLAVLGVAAWAFAPRPADPAAKQVNQITGDNNNTTQTMTTDAPADGKPAEQSIKIDGKGNTIVQETIK